MLNEDAYDAGVNLYGTYIRDEAIRFYKTEVIRIDASPLINLRFSKYVLEGIESGNENNQYQILYDSLIEEYISTQDFIDLDMHIFSVIFDFILSGNSIEEIVHIIGGMFFHSEGNENLLYQALLLYIARLQEMLFNILSDFINIDNAYTLANQRAGEQPSSDLPYLFNLKEDRAWHYKNAYISLERYLELGTGMILIELYLFSKKE